mmetsp:Transcript_26973/g.38679  ORF Transcript_26973/g.38679 Transcript_26973/m.38679 type:complete len:85 (+) Transcript_26973:61-315(+)
MKILCAFTKDLFINSRAIEQSRLQPCWLQFDSNAIRLSKSCFQHESNNHSKTLQTNNEPNPSKLHAKPYGLTKCKLVSLDVAPK